MVASIAYVSKGTSLGWGKIPKVSLNFIDVVHIPNLFEGIIISNTILYTSLELIRKISIMLYPIIPKSSLKVLSIFNISEKEVNFNSIKNNEILKTNSKLNKISILFKKIEQND